MTPLIWLGIAFLGACIGSFLTLATYRLPLDEKIGMTRSRCPSCKRTLTARDLVPVLSWIFSKGRCRTCHTKVSIRYPLTELACALAAVGAVKWFGLTWEAVAIAGLGWSIVAIFVTDLEHQIILDEVQIAIAAFGILYGVQREVEWSNMATGAIIGLLIGLTLKYGFIYFRNKDGLGLGDVKFLAAAGIWLADGANFVPFLFFSGILGVITGIGWQLIYKREHFPFGPSLALALLLCVLIPDSANHFWNLYGFIKP